MKFFASTLLLSFLFCVTFFFLSSISAAELDYYQILGIDEEATETDIKKKFRALSKKYHPDLNPSEKAREKFKKIQEAYDVLSDKKKRKIYQIRGHEGLKMLEESQRGGHHQQQHHMMDPFAEMFGGGGGRQQQQQGGVNKGPDAQLNLQVPLSEIYKGATHRLSIQKQKLCRQCKGTGAASKEDFHKCPHCKGKGQITQKVQLMPGFVQQMQQPCPHCGGKGKSIKKKCPSCKGKKTFRGDQQLEVDVEAGVPDGHKIIHEMEADQNPDQIPGDVVFVVQTTPDPQFTRRDTLHLEHTMRLTLKEALLGFSKKISHMDGHAVSVDRQNEVTQYGHRIEIEGEGMPRHQVPSEKGNLGVTFTVHMPKKLSSKQRAVLSKVLDYKPPEFESDDDEDDE